MSLPDEDYARLLTLRTGLRHFQRWSEQQAREAGLTPAQHQLLLAVRGHPDRRGPTIGELADYLLLRHHSTVELVDRADVAGLVVRIGDAEDHRIVRIQLTPTGTERIEALSALHLEELERLALRLPAAWQGLAPVQRTHGFAGAPARVPKIQVVRVYEDVAATGMRAVLVDRLWPRGISRDAAPFGLWLKDVAPSTELRKWYGHVPERFTSFARRYRRELAGGAARDALEQLRDLAVSGDLALVTATKDTEHSSAAVLRDVLADK
jgi:uncharacterized protein YeaO (DUF488 family)/DNA-binding MarR family transcriptional regulator